MICPPADLLRAQAAELQKEVDRMLKRAKKIEKQWKKSA